MRVIVSCSKYYKNAIFPEYINDCKCDNDFNSSTKKVILSEHFKILNVAYIFKTILSKLFIIFYNEIVTFPMKSTKELECVSNYQRCFVSEGIYSFERLRESVINNPVITTAFCFITE